MAYVATLRLLQGDEAGSRAAVMAGLDRCGDLEFPRGPFTTAFIRTFDALIHCLRGDATEAAFAATEVLRLGERHGFFDWLMTGRIYLALSVVCSDPTPAAVDEMSQAVAMWRAAGGGVLLPTLLIEEAWGHLALGNTKRAQERLADAEECITRGQHLSSPELHRLRAELLARTTEPDDPAVSALLNESVRLAVEQGTHLFVLRSAGVLMRRGGITALDSDLVTGVDEAVRAFGPASELPARLLGEHHPLIGLSRDAG
jgi:hypothetical protein